MNSVGGELKESVREVFDNEFTQELSEKKIEELDNEAVGLLQRLFIEHLHFEPVTGPFGRAEIDVGDWNKLAGAEKAFIVAEVQNFRVLYIRLDKLTRTAERYAVSSLKAKRWAREGEYLAVFHSRNSDVWHLVSPHMSEGRTILRRYVIGEGETHRTVSENLAKMDASKPEPLFDRIQGAFRLKTVTKEFYEDYKRVFNLLKEHLRSEGIGISESKEYTHLLLNRLMFLYYIQKKKWLNNNKNFMRWYLEKYKQTSEEDAFHRRWLNTLFFEAMNHPPRNKNISVGFPEKVAKILNELPFLNGGLFEKHKVDELGIELPDSLLHQIIKGFLENYNFTITEESPFDIDVAVDPAMLGKIYESLIAEEEREKAGIFYTPRIEVDFMCRLALYEYLTTPKEGSSAETLDDSLLRQLQSERKEDIIKFLFTSLEDWNPKQGEKLEPLKKILREVKVVDPACGSGAFLVGMLQVINELNRKLNSEPSYELKKQIINENLYGADIKDWAVRVAEFRLWLALVERETKIPVVEPVLPNFTLKLRVGDSIVQKIGDDHIRIERISGRLRGKMQKDIQKLEKLKEEYFKGKSERLKEIRDLQGKIVERYIEERAEELQDKQKQEQQTTLSGGITEESQEILRKIKTQIQKLEDTKEKLKKAGSKGILLWDLDFPEVMLSGGFDISISNPPYVRQEKIIRQDLGPEELEGLSDAEICKLKKGYKDDLVKYAIDRYGMEIGKRSDLYVYFFLKGLELLNPSGNLVFISSNSWLDVDFGKYLQETVLRESYFEYLIDNQAKRSFEESDINTVISVMGKKTENILSGETKFVAFKNAFEDVIDPETMATALLGDIEGSREVKIKDEAIEVALTDSFRLVRVPHTSLWKLGGGEAKKPQTKLNPAENKKNILSPLGNYSGDKWGKYIRAPDVFFKILEKGKDLFVPLKEVAEVKFGLKTGANEFFYLTEDEIKKWKIEREFWMHKENREWVPNYVIKSPRECKSIKVNLEDLKYRVLMIHKDKSDLKENVLKYIRWGEKEGFHKRPTCASRERWYELPELPKADILFRQFFDRIFNFPLQTVDMPTDHTFYYLCLKGKNKEMAKAFAAKFNSTLYSLIVELYGRTMMGQGVLIAYGPEIRPVPTLRLSKLPNSILKKLEKSFDGVAKREIDTIFEEIGADSPEEVSLDKVKSDRRELDKVIMSDILGLTESEQLEVYKGVVDLVKTRIEKAQSV